MDPKCNYNYSYKMEEEREYNTEERKCDNFKRERKRFEVVILWALNIDEAVINQEMQEIQWLLEGGEEQGYIVLQSSERESGIESWLKMYFLFHTINKN